ncbi:MAG TPA: zinc-dependent metalloprotease, partial [Sporichthya sp.]|nr:zinc-dependent metalloprotease [Sporichthya sp.]
GVARATGRRLMPAPPPRTAIEIAQVVGQLRTLALDSRAYVRDFTGMIPAGPEPPVLVVDRDRWLEVNIESFGGLIAPLLERMAEERSGATGALMNGVGSRVTGAELGALLAFVGSRVLGQYEPFLPAPAAKQGERGSLLLVAPNIVAVERELRVDPTDFRLWVCLHEETHRTQFTAVPWLADHVRSEIEGFLAATDVDPAAMLRQLGRALQGLGTVVRGQGSMLDLVATPGQRDALDRITAVMSLLEGHADFVMDGVGPEVIPSVSDIRAAFQQRRQSATGLDALMRRLLGLEAKLKQYADGVKFVSAVVDQVGMAGFNKVWESPETLPSLAELHDPAVWVARVHPTPGA